MIVSMFSDLCRLGVDSIQMLSLWIHGLADPSANHSSAAGTRN